MKFYVLTAGLLVVVALLFAGSAFAQSARNYPLHQECVAPEGLSYACPWNNESNFEAISTWLWRNEDIDIRNWILETDRDLWRNFHWYKNGRDADSDRFLLSEKTPEDYVAMIHVSGTGTCGLAFMYQGEWDYYAALIKYESFSDEATFFVDTRYVGGDLPIDPIDFELRETQLMMVVIDGLHRFYINGYFVGQFLYRGDRTGQVLALAQSGSDECYTSDVAWIAMPTGS